VPLQLDVLAPGQVGVHARALGDHADRLPHGAGLGPDVVARHSRLAGVRSGQRRQHLHCRGLARAVRAEQSEYGSGRNLEGETVQSPNLTGVCLDQFPGFDHRFLLHFSRTTIL
jgi:hypothetical protein